MNDIRDAILSDSLDALKGLPVPASYRGVVVLKDTVRTGKGYGKLPKAGLVETFDTGQNLTVVGYGTRDFQRGGGQPQPTGFAVRGSACR